MSALDLSIAEKLDFTKNTGNRRKAAVPQRRQMMANSSDTLEVEHEGSIHSDASSEKAEQEITESKDINNNNEAINNSVTASLLEQRDRMAELLSMTSRLQFPLGQTGQQGKVNPTDALAFLQAYGKMRSSSMMNVLQMMPPTSTSGRSFDDQALNSPTKMMELVKTDKNGFEQNRNNNSSNGNSRSPSESSTEIVDETMPSTSHEDVGHMMLPRLNTTLQAGSLMQQRLRRYLDDVQPAEAPGIPERTKKQNRWAFNVWREWARKRNMLEDSFVGPFKGVPLDVGQANEAELDFWLSKFVVEIRRKDGNPYPPHTLMQIVMGIQRYLRQQAGKPSICILDRSNPTYTKFRGILDGRIKELTNNGATAMQKPNSGMMMLKDSIHDKLSTNNDSNELFQTASEDGMWAAGIIGKDSAQALLNAVFFYNHQTFGIHYVDDHWNLRAENFRFGNDSTKEGSPGYVEFTPSPTSMMVATATAMGNTVLPKKVYRSTNGSRCIVSLYEKYLALVPALGPFYRHPVEPTIVDRSVKFSEQWVGKNRLRAMLKHLIETYKHSAVSQRGQALKQSSPSMRVLSPHTPSGLPQSLIQLPSQGAGDFLPAAASEKLGIIRPMSVLRSSSHDKDDTEPPSKIQRVAESPGADVFSPKTDDSKTDSTAKISYDNIENNTQSHSSTLELAVPDSIKAVTILRGSRKITIQLD